MEIALEDEIERSVSTAVMAIAQAQTLVTKYKKLTLLAKQLYSQVDIVRVVIMEVCVVQDVSVLFFAGEIVIEFLGQLVDLSKMTL